MISVIIAAYNAEKYITECMESVLKQTYRELEVIVVDDGSVDGTWNILQNYAKRDSRVIPVRQENQGPAAARNTAFVRMKGEYFTVIDADDWIEADCYQEAYRAAKVTNSDMVIWGFQKFSENGCTPQKDPMLKQGIYDEEECFRLWLDFIYREKTRVNPYFHCRLIRTSFLNEYGLRFNPKLIRSEDYMLLCKIHYYCKKIYSMANRTYLHYRQNEESITHNYVGDYFDMVLLIYRDILNFATDNYVYSNELQKRLEQMCLHRTFLAIGNERRHEVGEHVKRENVKRFIKNPVVRKAAKSVRIREGIKLYGKRYIAFRFGMSAMLLKVCRE